MHLDKIPDAAADKELAEVAQAERERCFWTCIRMSGEFAQGTPEYDVLQRVAVRLGMIEYGAPQLLEVRDPSQPTKGADECYIPPLGWGCLQPIEG